MSAQSAESIRRFREWVGSAGDGKYAPAQAREVLVVSRVNTDSNGAIVSVDGGLVQTDNTISEARFTVPMAGKAATPGDYLLVGRDASRAVGAELTYLGHTQSLYPGAGLVVIDANIAAPSFASPPFTTSIVKLPGSITAKASIFFNAVPEATPSGYTVSYRINGGEWRDRHVPHIGGVQECDLGSDLPPSATIDAHLRTVCAWAASQSPPSADETFATADDDSSPGTVSAITVSVATPGVLIITPTATLDSDLFRGYVYYINDAASGSPDITSVPISGAWEAVLPPGTYYVAAVAVSKSGTLGARFPATANTYQGPYVVADQSANLDTTPPSGMGAPTLATDIVQFADNTWHGYMTVTLPSYSPPSDLAVYEVSIVVDDGRKWQEVIAAGDTSGRYEVGFGGFTVKVRARDQAGNAPTFGTAATTTIAAPVLSNTAPTVTTASVGAGIKITWSAITNALGYEIQRATDGSGTGATTIGTASARWFVDTLVSDTIILPTYYYRVRAISVSNQSAVTGTYSSWVAGTVGAVDAQNLRLNSIVAAQIAADNAIFNKIVAGAILSGSFSTDVSPNNRVELNGTAAGGGAASSLRFYESIAGVSKLRGALTGAGLSFYTDAGVRDFYIERDPLNARLIFGGPSQIFSYANSAFLVGLTAGRTLTVTGDSVGLAVREAFNAGLGYNTLNFGMGSGTFRGIFLHETNAGGTTPLYGMYLGTTGISLTPSGSAVPDVLLTRTGVGAWTMTGSLALASGITTDLAVAGLLQAGGTPSFVSAYPFTIKQAAQLGTTAANTQPLAAWQYPAGSGAYTSTLRMNAYRGASSGATYESARFRLLVDDDNFTHQGGGIDLGWRVFAPYFSLHTGGTARLYWDDGSTRVLIPDSLRVDGSISKGSGTFDIPHPDPDKDADGYRLRHSLVESPTRGDNLYRFALLVSAAEADGETEHTLELPDYWPWLNENGQCWCNGRRHFGQMWAEVASDGRSVTWCATKPGWYELLVLGTRKDAVAVRGWDETGGIEPLASDADRERQHKRRDKLGRKIAPRKRQEM